MSIMFLMYNLFADFYVKMQKMFFNWGVLNGFVFSNWFEIDYFAILMKIYLNYLLKWIKNETDVTINDYRGLLFYLFCLNTQFAEVCEVITYNVSDMYQFDSNYMKINK